MYEILLSLCWLARLSCVTLQSLAPVLYLLTADDKKGRWHFVSALSMSKSYFRVSPDFHSSDCLEKLAKKISPLSPHWPSSFASSERGLVAAGFYLAFSIPM